MKKRLSLLILCSVVLLLPLLSIGCETTGGGGAAAPLYATQAQLTDAIAKLGAEINGKANKDDLNSQMKLVTDLMKNISAPSINTYGKDQLYTKAEVDAVIEAKIAALKSNQAWITGSSGGTGGTTTPVTGNVNVITSPTNVQILGSTQLCYTAKIQNGVNQWVYARPIITINAASGQSPTIVTRVVLTMGGSAISLTGDSNILPSVTNHFQFTPTLPSGVAISSVTMIPTYGGNGGGEIQIAANTTIDVLVCITITAPSNIIWNVGTSINWRSL